MTLARCSENRSGEPQSSKKIEALFGCNHRLVSGQGVYSHFSVFYKSHKRFRICKGPNEQVQHTNQHFISFSVALYEGQIIYVLCKLDFSFLLQLLLWFLQLFPSIYQLHNAFTITLLMHFKQPMHLSID